MNQSGKPLCKGLRDRETIALIIGGIVSGFLAGLTLGVITNTTHYFFLPILFGFVASIILAFCVGVSFGFVRGYLTGLFFFFAFFVAYGAGYALLTMWGVL